jgi:hypothetical protein
MARSDAERKRLHSRTGSETRTNRARRGGSPGDAGTSGSSANANIAQLAEVTRNLGRLAVNVKEVVHFGLLERRGDSDHDSHVSVCCT